MVPVESSQMSRLVKGKKSRTYAERQIYDEVVGREMLAKVTLVRRPVSLRLAPALVWRKASCA